MILTDLKFSLIVLMDTRYPGMYEPVSDEEYKEALNLAVGVFEWAGKIIKNES
jgi:hypothetical protein